MSNIALLQVLTCTVVQHVGHSAVAGGSWWFRALAAACIGPPQVPQNTVTVVGMTISF
ncbi:hypothetical protein [Nonomuraea sp. NPDC049028]|uniref:hypothetical protein n=1 Tax=Nonomuraea sp. NPDC049028 TaxID=3364348 RepID=UPI00371217C1